jgi:hypothetical protein
VVHLVDSWSDVPQALQSKAQRIELGPRPANPGARVSADTVAASTEPGLDWLSFGLGAGCGALLAVMLFLVRGTRPLLRIALSLGALAVLASLVGAAYLGLLRRETGQSSSTLGSPSEIVNDAKKAVEAMEQRNNQQDRVLEEIKREAK